MVKRNGIEEVFDVSFLSRLTRDEKQIQQSYRPVIGIHKWFARRPGSLFRGLLLSEFGQGLPLSSVYFRRNDVSDVTIADPFMGGGTTLYEAIRIGCNVIGFDINPMSYWVVRQSLKKIDRAVFRTAAEKLLTDMKGEVKNLYNTRCTGCAKITEVKYFLWVKLQRCTGCGKDLDLFPGYLIAGNERHTHFVLHCPECKNLVEVKELPEEGKLVKCPSCHSRFDWAKGPARRNRYKCHCGHEGRYPRELREDGPPRHRLFGLEYRCETCRNSHEGRWFKTADEEDLERFGQACRRLKTAKLPIPNDMVPDGDETKRLHRWGYRKFSEMFNERQKFSLGLLLEKIRAIREDETRQALATVFSDFIRYQNMLCRYDTYALKCQDIFAVHGFPVGLIQCENNVLGIPGVGGGGFSHFVEKYDRAKAYCHEPFETQKSPRGVKRIIQISGERIEAEFVKSPRLLKGNRKAYIRAGSIEDAKLGENTLDGVFTDPPYFDNVQYAELMDFCFAWLRLLLGKDFKEFSSDSTKSTLELTGNRTTGKDLAHFTTGLSRVFSAAAKALKPGAPFVFTYHHNDINAYVPIVIAILDAGLECTATPPCPAEMGASLHISGTGSSVVDTIIVCRKNQLKNRKVVFADRSVLKQLLGDDQKRLLDGGIQTTRGDLYCISLGHLARIAIGSLTSNWKNTSTVVEKMKTAEACLSSLVEKCDLDSVVMQILNNQKKVTSQSSSGESSPPSEALLQLKIPFLE